MTEDELRKRIKELEGQVAHLSAEQSSRDERLNRERAERERTEAILRDSEPLCSPIFSHIGVGIAIITSKMEIIFMNRMMEEINPTIDVSRRPLCYQSFNDPPRLECCTYCSAVETFRDGQVHTSISDTPMNGTIRNFKLTTVPIHAADGSISAVIEVVEDVTERMRAEDALRESEQRYRGLVELSPEAIFVHTGGKLIFANGQGVKLLGAHSAEELHGREALDFVHPDSRELVKARIAKAFESGAPNPPHEEVFLRVDGSPVPVEVASAPFRYGGENALQVIARDITERKRMQDETIRTQKLESLGVLAGGIAHDFNNILTGITGNLSLAKLRIDPSSAALKRLELCEEAAMHASRLTRQLLTFARGGEPLKKRIEVAPLVQDAVSFALRGSNVKSVVDLDQDLWCLEADESQLTQALSNLLLNAVQAMPRGGEVRVRAVNELLAAVNPHQLPAGDYLAISVEDSGCGIAQGDLLRVFDPYFTTRAQGSGLGLTSVYSIVKRHGGAVEASSAPGVGSCFVIHLPALAEGVSPRAAAVPGGGANGSLRILVMDDEDFIREIAAEILRYLGYQVDTCADGLEAASLFRAAREADNPYSAAILDLTIPGGVGGIDAAGLLLAVDPDAVLIVSSGYSNDPVVANYPQYGFKGVISKPFGAGDVAQELQRLLK